MGQCKISLSISCPTSLEENLSRVKQLDFREGGRGVEKSKEKKRGWGGGNEKGVGRLAKSLPFVLVSDIVA